MVWPVFFMYCCAAGVALFAVKFLLLLEAATFRFAMYAFLYSGVFILVVYNYCRNYFIFFVLFCFCFVLFLFCFVYFFIPEYRNGYKDY